MIFFNSSSPENILKYCRRKLSSTKLIYNSKLKGYSSNHNAYELTAKRAMNKINGIFEFYKNASKEDKELLIIILFYVKKINSDKRIDEILVSLACDENEDVDLRNRILNNGYIGELMDFEKIASLYHDSRFNKKAINLLRYCKDKRVHRFGMDIVFPQLNRKFNLFDLDIIRFSEITSEDKEKLIEIYDNSKDIHVRHTIMQLLFICNENGLEDFFIKAYKKERSIENKFTALIGIYTKANKCNISGFLDDYNKRYPKSKTELNQLNSVFDKTKESYLRKK